MLERDTRIAVPRVYIIRRPQSLGWADIDQEKRLEFKLLRCYVSRPCQENYDVGRHLSSLGHLFPSKLGPLF